MSQAAEITYSYDDGRTIQSSQNANKNLVQRSRGLEVGFSNVSPESSASPQETESSHISYIYLIEQNTWRDALSYYNNLQNKCIPQAVVLTYSS